MIRHLASTSSIGELAEGWSVGRVSQVLERPIYNGVSPQSRPNPPGTPILNVACISEGRCDPQSVTYVDLDRPATEDMLARRGDFFVLRGNGNRDYVATGGLLTEDPPSGCVFSDLLFKIPFHPNAMEPGYMPLLWQSSTFLRRLQSRAVSGSGLWKIGVREIRRHEFACPPKEEQAEIVRIMRAADGALAEAKEKLSAARRLKKALMQELFTLGMPRRTRHLKPARVFQHDFVVPADWDVAPLAASVSSVEYGTNAPSNDGRRGLPVVAIPEVIASRFRLGDSSYAEVSEGEAHALRLAPGDVLLVRTNGNPEYIGKSTVIGEEARERHMIFASYLIRVRTRGEKVSGRYLNYFLASPLGRRQCLAMANTSAGNHNLGSRAIRQFCFPRPLPDEQAEIVALVDAAEDSIEAIQEEVAAIKRLRSALLDGLVSGHVRVAITSSPRVAAEKEDASSAGVRVVL